MIPIKGNKYRSEYIKLHYKTKILYRKYYPYIPFRRIQKIIHRRWQIICYNRIHNHNEYPEHNAHIKWSDTLEVSEIL
jgi:hypothetical protein